MKCLMSVMLVLLIASLSLGYFSLEGGVVGHAASFEAPYSSEPWIAPGLSLAGLYEVSDRSTLGLTGEFAMTGLEEYAGLVTLDYRFAAFRARNSAVQVGVAFGLLIHTIPEGEGLIRDWEPHLHLALGPRFVALGEISNRIDFKVSLATYFVGLYLSEYPSTLPVVDYISLGVSLAYVF